VAIGDGRTTFRTVDVATSALTYAAADQVADFGALPTDITVVISQVSPTEGAGLAATSELHV
jgi:hypothetical protein